MERLRAKLVALRYLLATAWPIMLITVIGLAVAYQFVAPEPPRHLVISTGGESGAYYAYAKRYATLLAAKGITLDVRTSAGSRQNLERVEKGEADVGFVQGGIAGSQDGDAGDNGDADARPTPLRSLGSVAYEPVWVETPECSACDECTTLAPSVFAYNDQRKAVVTNPKGASFADLVRAAEKCTAGCLHPGTPWNPAEPGLDGLQARAAKFN